MAGLGLKYPHADVYSPQLAVVLDLLQALGLIAKERAAWRLNDRALAAWLALDVTAMNRVLIRHALQRYVPAEPGTAHVVLRLAAADLQAGSGIRLRSCWARCWTREYWPARFPANARIGSAAGWRLARALAGWISGRSGRRSHVSLAGRAGRARCFI